MHIEDPMFCVCYTVIIPPIFLTIGSGFILLAVVHEHMITEIIYASLFATIFILFGLYMCFYTAKEFIHFN